MFFRNKAKSRNSKSISTPPILEPPNPVSIDEHTLIPDVQPQVEKLPIITTITPQSQTSPFLSLPAELRNQIYKCVFTPTRCPDGLIPSSQDLSNLTFLFTCRQIYHEAHTMAYMLTYSVTNRWHREDLLAMQAHFNSLPQSYEIPITELEFAAQWRRPYMLGNGKLQFLDSICDYTTLIWNVVGFFPTVTKIIIHRDREAASTAETLRRILQVDLDIRDKGLAGTWNTGADCSVWKVEDATRFEDETVKLSSASADGGRSVEIECRAMKKEDIVWPTWGPYTATA